jgi:hypothetical protein
MQFAYALRAPPLSLPADTATAAAASLPPPSLMDLRARACFLSMDEKSRDMWTRLRVTVKTSENRSTLYTPNNKLKTVPKDEKYRFRSMRCCCCDTAAAAAAAPAHPTPPMWHRF